MSRLLTIDAAAFAESFAHRPISVHHALANHPLLTVEALADLADALPRESVEHNLGALPTVLADGNAPRVDLSPGEIVRGIESNGCWMVLKNVEQRQPYRGLLDSSLDEVNEYVADREGGMRKREGFIFLSAPNSTTPAHIDPEHNLLLQIRGTKRMNVGGYPDRRTEQLEIERTTLGGHRNIDWLPTDEQAFDLGPGDGVYMPVNAPHWVKNGEAVSVSLSVTFRTETSERAELLHTVNAHLRRLHLPPTAPGANRFADRVKAAALETVLSLRRRRG